MLDHEETTVFQQKGHAESRGTNNLIQQYINLEEIKQENEKLTSKTQNSTNLAKARHEAIFSTKVQKQNVRRLMVGKGNEKKLMVMVACLVEANSYGSKHVEANGYGGRRGEG